MWVMQLSGRPMSHCQQDLGYRGPNNHLQELSLLLWAVSYKAFLRAFWSSVPFLQDWGVSYVVWVLLASHSCCMCWNITLQTKQKDNIQTWVVFPWKQVRRDDRKTGRSHCMFLESVISILLLPSFLDNWWKYRTYLTKICICWDLMTNCSVSV